MLLQSRAIGIRRIPCAQHTKGELRGREVRLCLLDNAPQRFKCFAMSVHQGAHARVEGRPAQVLEPGYAHALETAVQRAREALSWFVDGERRAGIGSSNRTQCQ